MTSETMTEQIDTNYAAFVKLLPELIAANNNGRHALMRDGKVVAIFDTGRDAVVAGQLLFPTDRLFSVQAITNAPANLGYFSYAMSQ